LSLTRLGEESLQSAREFRLLAGLDARHHHRHRIIEPGGEAGAEDDFFLEQRVHRLHAVHQLSQQLTCLGIPPGSERRVLRRLFLRQRQGPADRHSGIRDRAIDDRLRGKVRKQGRTGPQLCRELRQLALDLHERREQLQVGLRLGAPGNGCGDRARQCRD
jgi:hypothetical protein